MGSVGERVDSGARLLPSHPGSALPGSPLPGSVDSSVKWVYTACLTELSE